MASLLQTAKAAEAARRLAPSGAATGELRELRSAATDTAGRVLDFVRVYHAVNGLPPDIPAIMAGVGLRSSSAVHYHLHRLAEAGALVRHAGTRRCFVPAAPLALAGASGTIDGTHVGDLGKAVAG